MLYSERKNWVKPLGFAVFKVMIGCLLKKYLLSHDWLHLKYNQSELDDFFLLNSKNIECQVSNYDAFAITEDLVFDMIEIAASFLYQKHVSESRSYIRPGTSDIEHTEFWRFLDKINEPLKLYGHVFDTHNGIQKLPDDGMNWLVEENITTQEPVRFENKLEEAKNQFLQRGATIETKKSACAKLADVIDFIRPDTKKTWELSTDVEKLMWIVNSFDIRHNTKATVLLSPWNKNDENFVEWVFYSLLNCINFYLKSFHK